MTKREKEKLSFHIRYFARVDACNNELENYQDWLDNLLIRITNEYNCCLLKEEKDYIKLNSYDVFCYFKRWQQEIN